MAKRGGSARKEWKAVEDDFFVGSAKGASDSLSHFGFPTPRETSRDP